jgi:hypothetical protein
VRLDDGLLARVDAEAARSGESRASTIRRLLDRSVGDPGVDVAQIRRALAMTPAERVRGAAHAERRLARVRGRAAS